MSATSSTQGGLFRQPKAVWAVAFACVISFMGIGLVDPILPALAQQLDATPSQVSLLFTSYLLVTAVMMLLTGWVSSRVGAKATLIGGLAIIVVFAALAGLSGSVDEIVGFRAGWGLGNALFIATSLSVIVASASGGFAGAIILYETALGVGIALGPLVGGLLGSVSWRAPFFGVAVLMAVALVATLVLLDKTPKPAEKIGLLDPIKALRHRTLATIAVTAFAYNWGFFTLLAYSPYSMGDLDELALGGVFTAWGVLVALFAVFVAPALERRFGTVRVVYAVLALMAVDLLVIAVWQTVPAVVITAVIVAGTMIGLNNTLVTQAVMSVAPVPRPVASASYSFVRFLGGGLAPWVGGLIAAAVLPNTPFYVAAGVVLVGLLILTTAHRPLRAVETAPGAEDDPEAESGSGPGERPVLVAVDGGDDAAAVADAGGRLARLAGAPVLLVHVPEIAEVGAAVASDRASGATGDGAGASGATGEGAGASGATGEGSGASGATGEGSGAGDPDRLLARLRADGIDARRVDRPEVAAHDGVGAALVALARDRAARAVVVGRPHGGAFSALVRPSADRTLWEEAPCPVVVVPAGAVAPLAPTSPASPAAPTSPAAAAAPAAVVHGRVRDATGHAVGAVLTLVGPDGAQLGRARTEEDGSYRLVPDRLADGTALLLARGRDDTLGHAAPVVTTVPLHSGRLRHDVVLEAPAGAVR